MSVTTFSSVLQAELENRATSIVPEPFQPDAVEEEAKEAKETKETKDCLRSSVEGLPGAVEEEPKALPPPAPKKSLHSMESEHSALAIAGMLMWKDLDARNVYIPKRTMI